MNRKLDENKIEVIGNGLATVLGLAFLGELFGLWNFNLFDGWWILFLYIPAICGILTKGFTPGLTLLSFTAIILTAQMFSDIDGRLWGGMLIIYFGYLAFRNLKNKWKSTLDK